MTSASNDLIEIEKLMLEYYKGDNNEYIRWTLRPNSHLKNARPFDLIESGGTSEVLSAVKAFTDHQKFLRNIGIG
jgi:uncharacterized protein (DUF2384 family)